MGDADLQNIALDAAPVAEREVGAAFPISREGRRQAIVLLLGVITIWIFALWSLISALDGGLGGVEMVTSLLMLGILVVAPLVAWTLLEEANSRYNLDDEGIRYHSIAGIDLEYRWDELSGFESKRSRGRLARFFLGDRDEAEVDSSAARPNDGREAQADDSDTHGEEDIDTLLLKVRKDRTGEISNPLVRFLHRQAHSSSLPIYGHLEGRGELLDAITSHLDGE